MSSDERPEQKRIRPLSAWKAKRNVNKRRRLDKLKWVIEGRFDYRDDNRSSDGSDDDLEYFDEESSSSSPTETFARCPSPDPGQSPSDNSPSDASDDSRDSASVLSGDSLDSSGDTSSDSSGDTSDGDNESRSSASSDEDGEVIHFNDDTEKENYVIHSLREWALDPGVLSMRKVDNLLHRLSPLYPNLPRSYKTLLSTGSHSLNIFDLPSGGVMWYKSIRVNLDDMDVRSYLQKFGCITLDIGIDGIPLYWRSGKKKFWPILGKFVHALNEPFIIGIYFGTHDPADVHEFLEDFVFEVRELLQTGYEVDDVVYPFEIRRYICDAPARQLIKIIIGHPGYCSCEKCIVYGEYVDGRVTFTDLNADLRSDDSFRARAQPRHHQGDSPIEEFTNMVSQFPLESMHLVYQGSFKRLLYFWLHEKGPWKLHKNIVAMISALLNYLAFFHPSDFNRPPRGLDEFTFF